MSDSIWLGKGMDKLVFYLDDYEEPDLKYERETMFGCKSFKMEECQKTYLIYLVSRYLKAQIKFQSKKTEDLKRELKELTKDKADVERRLAKARTIV